VKINNFIALLTEHKVVIPPIQRDYAQGRNNEKVKRIRDKFLKNLIESLSDDSTDNKPIELDFIYGYVQKDKTDSGSELSVFKPLDGQQRLTTLFLIHWYVAAIEKKLDIDVQKLLNKFSYATRTKSRQFCEELVNFIPNTEGETIKSQIVNQPWFFYSWFNDPTISSMLVVLEVIEKEFEEITAHDVWEKLTLSSPPITFNLLEMDSLGLPDDLYIKMNSRGKELTNFEHFKSQFSMILSNDLQKEFNIKIDKQWSDLFWDLFKEKEPKDLAQKVDSGFLGFFWYITDILIAINNIIISDDYWIEKMNTVYSANEDNIRFLFSCLDLFSIPSLKSEDLFETLFYIDGDKYKSGKTRIYFNSAKINLFQKCAETYGYGEKKNTFSIGEQLLLYACIIHVLENTDNFNNNIRKIRNLILSSEFLMRKEYFGSQLKDIENIVCNKMLSDKPRFSKDQLQEESIKSNLIKEDISLKDVIYKLEDHHLLRGTISIFDLDKEIGAYACIFQKIFTPNCDYEKINLSILTIGDYSQGYRRLRRFGNHIHSTWRELFTPSEHRKGFDKTKEVLKKYLQSFISDSQLTIEKLIKDSTSKNKDWYFYYINYNSFRKWSNNGTSGFYSWDNRINNPFVCFMMYRTQFNGRHWNPFLLAISSNNESCSLQNYGNKLQFTNNDVIFLISMINNAFVFEVQVESNSSRDALDLLKDKELLDENGMLLIEQSSAEVDNEDRIIKCITLLKNITELLSEIKGVIHD